MDKHEEHIMKLMLRVLGMLRHREAQFSSIGPTLNRAGCLQLSWWRLPWPVCRRAQRPSPRMDARRSGLAHATAPAGPTPPESFAPAPEFNNQTLRLIVHTSRAVAKSSLPMAC